MRVNFPIVVRWDRSPICVALTLGVLLSFVVIIELSQSRLKFP